MNLIVIPDLEKNSSMKFLSQNYIQQNKIEIKIKPNNFETFWIVPNSDHQIVLQLNSIAKGNAMPNVIEVNCQ